MNEELSVAELQAMLAAAKKEIALLKKQIALLKSGGSLLSLEDEASGVDSTPKAMKLLTFSEDTTPGGAIIATEGATGEGSSTELGSVEMETGNGLDRAPLKFSVDEEERQANEEKLKTKVIVYLNLVID